MSNVYKDYWMEAICQGADEAEVSLTREQAETIAYYAASAHDHYGQAFYEPDVGEYYDVLKNEHARHVCKLMESHDIDRREYERRIENLQYEIRRLENVIFDMRRER